MAKKDIQMPGLAAIESELVINLPIGPLIDLLHCEFIKGRHGETIVNGGLPPYTVVIGSVNNYKTTIIIFLALMSLMRIREAGYPTRADMLDTEISFKFNRLFQLASAISPQLAEWVKDIWHTSDTNSMSLNKWVTEFDKFVDEKEASKEIEVTFDAFTHPKTNKPVVNKLPSLLLIDTFTKFTSDKAFNKLEDNDLDSTDTNTVFMNIGMFKKKFLLPLPRNLSRGNIYALITAHVGEKLDMATGPAMYMKPSKQLQFLKAGDEIEGGTKELKQAPNLMLQAHTAKPLTIKNAKGVVPEYPFDDNDTSTDLNTVLLTTIRNKSGQSGISIPLIVSQSRGVLLTLSAFHYLKEVGKFGIGGNNLSFYMELRPEVKLQRTTVRTKIDNDSILARAIELTASIFQLVMTRVEYKDNKYIIPMENLYTKIKDMGYSWDILLDTRGYPLIDNYNPEYKPYLSAPDLLDIYLEEYHPFWYPKDGIKNRAIQ